MGYPTLRVVDGPERGREFPLPGGTFEIGSEVSGPGRLEGAGVAPRHAEFIGFDEEFFLAHKVDGELLVNSASVEEAELKPGDTLAIGVYRMIFEIAEGDPPQERARRKAIEQAAAGGQPYRWTVRFNAVQGQESNALLEAGGGILGLITLEGKTIFRVPLSEVGDVSLPSLRNALIKLSAGGVEYSITLLNEAWIADQIEFEEPGGPDLDASSSEHTIEGAQVLSAIELGLRGLGAVADRHARKTWKKILEGELEPEKASAEAARNLLEFDSKIG